MKPKIIFQQTMKKNVVQGKEAVKQNIKNAQRIEVLKMGKYDNGDEFLIYKVVI